MSAELPQASPVPSPRPPAPRVTVRHEELKPQQQRIALLTILGPTLGVVLAIALGLWRGFRWLDLGMLLSGIVIGQLFLEVGFHRLFAHRAFDTPHWMRVVMAAGGSMTGQGRITHWVANHRRHHIHSDTPDDPHSPYVRATHDERGSEQLGMVRGLIHAQWGHMVTDDVPNCTLFARDMNTDPALRWVNAHYREIVTAGLLFPALIGFAITGDACDRTDAARAVGDAVSALGGLDVCQNIIGLASWKAFLELDEETWQKDLLGNLSHHLYIAQPAAKQMVEQGSGGTIAMVGSVSGLFAAPNHSAYGAAKSGVYGLVRSMSEELLPHEIRVNAVAPGSVRTPRIVAMQERGEAPSQQSDLDLMCECDDIGAAMLFLCSGLARKVTGQTLVVDAGVTTKFPFAVS